MKKIELIAEIAWGHNGDESHLMNLLRSSAASGCDWVSIHITDMSEYMVEYYGNLEGSVSAGREVSNVYNYLAEINISNDVWMKFNNLRKELGIKLMVMPNDTSSFYFTESHLSPDAYVLSAASFAEDLMVELLAKSKKKIFLRVGGSTVSEMARTIQNFEELDSNDLVLLHGVQNYPTSISDSFLEDLAVLKKSFNHSVGLADHIDGDDMFAQILPVLSVCYGVEYIEKHITLKRSDKDEDFEAALEPHELKLLSTNLKNAQAAIQRSNLVSLTETQKEYRKVSRKKIILSKNVTQEEVLTKDKIIYKRSHLGITIDELPLYLGRKFAANLPENETLLPKHFIK
jgi:sialic acid synthase SpsE